MAPVECPVDHLKIIAQHRSWAVSYGQQLILKATARTGRSTDFGFESLERSPLFSSSTAMLLNARAELGREVSRLHRLHEPAQVAKRRHPNGGLRQPSGELIENLLGEWLGHRSEQAHCRLSLCRIEPFWHYQITTTTTLSAFIITAVRALIHRPWWLW